MNIKFNNFSQIRDIKTSEVSCFATKDENSLISIYLITPAESNELCYLTKIHYDGYIKTFTYRRNLPLKAIADDFNEVVCAIEDEIRIDITIER